MYYLIFFTSFLLIGFNSTVFANDNSGIVHDYQGLQWHVESESKFYTYKEAKESCKNISIDDNNSFQWRLPNIKELEGLVAVENADTAQKEGFSTLNNEFYWSSTDYSDINYSKLVLNFASGNNFWRLDDDKANKLCVRGDEQHLYKNVTPAHKVLETTDTYDRFESTILGLKWHEPKNTLTYVYRDAKEYCGALPYYKGVLEGWNGNSDEKKDDIVNQRPILYFDLNIDTLSEREQSKLEYIVSIIPKDENVTLYCHTDRKSSDYYNQELSQRRCNSTASMFESLGISKERLILIAKGESEPLIETEDNAVEPRNRRVEVEFKKATNYRPAEDPWRLPTINELHSLVFIDQNLTIFDHPQMSSEYRQFWSSTPTTYEAYKFWTMEVIQGQGLDYANNEWEKNHVICVH